MIIGFIPIRVGSKSIPLKNVKLINGKPLAQWVIDISNKSKYIEKTVVSTDSEIISNKINSCDIFWRTLETAIDTASSELPLIEFCNGCNLDDIIVFLQATSPLITSNEIDLGIEKILKNEYDSIVSVVRQKKFIWDEDGIPKYDLENRPRRQDWNGFFVENGGFYISKVEDILKSKCRISGKIGMIECGEETYYEIDEPMDWIIIESLLKNKYGNFCRY
ncbi:MAG: acylneuraminate cytidylyltransferase family protein [bacterium]